VLPTLCSVLLASVVCLLPNAESASKPPRVLHAVAPAEVGMSEEKLAEAEQLFIDAVAEDRVLGYQLLVARRGGIVLQAAGGVRDRETGDPMTNTTLINLASMMKPVTAIGLLRLVDRGLLALDDPVAMHLPGFDEAPSNRITVRMLLLHTPGYLGFELFPDGVTPRSDAEPEAPSLIVEARELGARGPDVEPGTVFRYNNLGYNVAGALIEKLSGLKLDRYLVETLFEPLGMEDTHFDVQGPDPERLARQYWRKDGQWEDITGTPPPLVRANGGLVGTAEQYARFCQLLLDGGTYPGGEYLSPETLALATSPLEEVDAAYLTEEVEASMGLLSEWYEYRDLRDLGLDRHRGLGFVVSDDGVFSHGGVYGTWFWVDPSRDLFGIILTQSIYGGNPGQAFVEKVTAAVLD